MKIEGLKNNKKTISAKTLNKFFKIFNRVINFIFWLLIIGSISLNYVLIDYVLKDLKVGSIEFPKDGLKKTQLK